MVETTPSPAQHQDLLQMEARKQAANAISRSLLFALERQYLDWPLENEKATYIQSFGLRRVILDTPNFLRLEQVGHPVVGSPQQAFTALQTALSACHNPGRHTLIFLAGSDGRENHVYLGVRSHDMSHDSGDFLHYLGRFLQGNWPGTRLELCDQDGPPFQEQVLQPLNHDLRYALTLTGIPSLKAGDDSGYPQSLDRLLWGMRDLPFMYLVIAEPMAQVEVNEILHHCRDLVGQAHALTMTDLTQTLARSVSQFSSKTGFWGESIETKSSRSKERSGHLGIDVSREMGALALASVWPPAGLMMLLGDQASLFHFDRSWRDTEEYSETHITTHTTEILDIAGFSTKEAVAVGTEYINAHAQAAETLLQQHINRFDQARASGCWNVGIYFLATKPDVALQGATQLRALLSGEQSAFEPIRAHALKHLWRQGVADSLRDFEQPNLALVQPGIEARHGRLEHPLGPAFSGLTTPLSTKELALLVNLPRRQVVGLHVAPSVEFSMRPPHVEGSGIELGCLLDGGESTALSYVVPISTLSHHALLVGVAGSGKATTSHRLLSELRRLRIPFMVVETTKDEYAAWAIERNKGLARDDPKRIAIYMPGTQSWCSQELEDELVLNPLDVVWLPGQIEPRVLAHADHLKAILGGVFPLSGDLLPLLEEALFHIYRHPHDWLGGEPLTPDSPRPTLTRLVDQVETLAEDRGYGWAGRLGTTRALITRLQGLQRGWKEKLFNQPQSTPWPKLFDRPTVFNLSHLGDELEKAFIMALLLEFLCEYRRARRELSMTEEMARHSLRHLAVIEQARRILPQPEPGLPDQAGVQANLTATLINMLQEVSDYGQGVLVVDQAPAGLAPGILKNTNLKIIHRLVANDDQEAMTGCTNLTAQQSVIIGHLKPGQAVVCSDLDDTAAWIQVLKPEQ